MGIRRGRWADFRSSKAHSRKTAHIAKPWGRNKSWRFSKVKCRGSWTLTALTQCFPLWRRSILFRLSSPRQVHLKSVRSLDWYLRTGFRGDLLRFICLIQQQNSYLMHAPLIRQKNAVHHLDDSV